MSFWGIFLYSIRALAFAVPVGAVWAAVFFWRIMRRGEALHRTAFWSGLLLALYLAALLQITVIRDWGAFYAFMSQSHTMATVQPIPLKTTLEALEGGLWSLCYHVIGNMIWFVPFGLLGAAAYARLRRWRILLPEAAGLSLAIEALQWCFATGVSDIDDVLLNTLGAAFGLLLWQAVCAAYDRIQHSKKGDKK